MDTDSELMSLQQSVATLQHHDAITGTEREKVANDYKIKVLDSVKKSEESIGMIVGLVYKLGFRNSNYYILS